MSVQHNTYVIYGALLPYKQIPSYIYEKLEPYFDSAYDNNKVQKDGLTVLTDGMNGKYIVVGRVMAKSKVYQGLTEPISFYNIPMVDLQAFHNIIALIFPKPPKITTLNWIVLTHYR